MDLIANTRLAPRSIRSAEDATDARHAVVFWMCVHTVPMDGPADVARASSASVEDGLRSAQICALDRHVSRRTHLRE